MRNSIWFLASWIFYEIPLRTKDAFGKLLIGNGESLRHRQAGNFPALGEEQSSPLYYQQLVDLVDDGFGFRRIIFFIINDRSRIVPILYDLINLIGMLQFIADTSKSGVGQVRCRAQQGRPLEELFVPDGRFFAILLLSRGYVHVCLISFLRSCSRHAFIATV